MPYYWAPYVLERLGQCSVTKVKLIRRSTGLIIKAVKTQSSPRGVLPVADFAACVASHERTEVTEFPAYQEVL